MFFHAFFLAFLIPNIGLKNARTKIAQREKTRETISILHCMLGKNASQLGFSRVSRTFLLTNASPTHSVIWALSFRAEENGVWVVQQVSIPLKRGGGGGCKRFLPDSWRGAKCFASLPIVDNQSITVYIIAQISFSYLFHT